MSRDNVYPMITAYLNPNMFSCLTKAPGKLQ